MVFKPIDATRMTMTNNTTASFLDIVPPGMNVHPETLYPELRESQDTRVTEMFRIGTHLSSPIIRSVFAEGRAGRLSPHCEVRQKDRTGQRYRSTKSIGTDGYSQVGTLECLRSKMVWISCL